MEKLDKLYNDLNVAIQSLADPKYEAVRNNYKFINDRLNYIYNRIELLNKRKIKQTPEEVYKNVVGHYKDLKDELEKTINKGEQTELMKKYLNKINNDFLPPIENEQPEQPQPEEPEQPKLINEISQQITNGGGSLSEKTARLNPEATTPKPEDPPTPIDEYKKPEEEGEQHSEEEEKGEQHSEKEEEQQGGQHSEEEDKGNNNQIVQTPEQDFKLMKQEIKTLEDNPELDIIKGVGEVIEYMATSNLTDEMIDDLIDKLLGLVDSHGNPIFSNRFQIEDLVRNRKKRKRLRYLLPKRIINAEKPDEQKLIINPMLRRGRIASMTSAKTKYYNYV